MKKIYTTIIALVIAATSFAGNVTLSANGNKNDGWVNISWFAMNTSADCAHYEVEFKAGTDNFSTIAFVMPNEANNQQYSFSEKAKSGTISYRIKQVMNNGDVVYSRIITFSETTSVNIAVFPNPTTDYFMLNNVNDNVNVTVYDVNGKTIKTLNYSPNTKVSLAGVKAGTYVVKVNGNNNEFQSAARLIVK
jgi:hypothetical protein